MDFEKLIETRRSHRNYITGKPVPKEVLEKLLTEAALAPSSYNQQGWHVIAVTTQSEKEKIFKEACPQQQVLDGSAVLIVCGNLEQYKNLPEVVSKTPSMDDKTRDFIIKDAEKSYGSNPQFARDEALRSASLFTMAFLFAATNAGYGTGPMIGFDSVKISKLLDIKHPYFPVVMVSFGTVKNPPFPRGYRRPVSAFTRFI